MNIRFFRRLRIAPGLTINFSKAGASLSLGGRGMHSTIGPRGRRSTFGIPGTGLFYTTVSRRKGASDPVEVRPQDRLSLGFFKRLVTPKEEERFVDGCRRMVMGDEKGALPLLEEAVDLADGAFLAGFLALKQLQLETSASCLEAALENEAHLGRLFDKYGLAATLGLPITEEVSAVVGADVRGVLLGLVEVYQRQGRAEEALDCLRRLRALEPEDIVIRLSLAELLLDAPRVDRGVCDEVVHLGEGAENESAIHATLLLYKARALRRMECLHAARDTLTRALRRKKDRPEALLRAIRYERAAVYAALGQHRRARSEYETLYADAPDYKDVAVRLGVR